MIGRPLSYQGRAGLLTLHASERAGSYPPAIAEVRASARLVSVRPTGAAVLVCAEIDGALRLLRIERSDDHQLSVLSVGDRATIAAAVGALHRAGVPGDGGHHAA